MNPDKVKHLEMIQMVINRMASNSFAYKAWMVGILSALFAVSISTSITALLVLSLIPLLIFWLLDAYYLYQERIFREFYNEIRRLSDDEWERNPFSMDCRNAKESAKSYFDAVFSHTIVPLYGSLVVLIIVLLLCLVVGNALDYMSFFFSLFGGIK